MRRFILMAALLGLAVSAQAEDKKPNEHETAKGAAAGAAIGHEVGSGHAVAGAAAGGAIAHHESKKAEDSKQQ
jgi:uncharacterized protein YcfJ